MRDFFEISCQSESRNMMNMAEWSLRILILMGVLSAIPLKAEDYSRADLFGGYGLSADDHIFGLSSVDSTLHGLAAAAEFSLNSSLGIAAELGYGKSKRTSLNTTYDRSQATLLGGPRFSLRGKRARGFGHALIGICREAGHSPPGFSWTPDSNPERVSTANFAIALGGGLDVSLGKVISIRPVQLDFIITRHESYAASSHPLYELRYMGGVVVKIGAGRR